MNQISLLDTFLNDKDAYDIYCKLECIHYLLLNYGEKIKNVKFRQGIKEINNDIYDLMILLEKCKLLDGKKLSSFVRDFKFKLSDKKFLFDLKSNSSKVVSILDEFLNGKFGKSDLSFEEISSDNLIVDMKGKGYYYRRSLDGDIDKLLA